MGIYEFAESEGVAAEAESLAQGLLAARFRRRNEVSEAYYDMTLARDVSVDDVSKCSLDFIPRPTIVGAGITALPDGDRPLVVINADMLEMKIPLGEPIPLRELGPVLHEVTGWLGEEAPKGTVVIAAPTPQAHFHPSELAKSLASRCTLGALVETSDGDEAILTAGHAASEGARVRDSSDQSGKVVFSVDPARLPISAVSADVAVIQADSYESQGPAVRGASKIQRLDEVTMYGARSGEKSAGIQSYCSYYEHPAGGGAWGAINLTNEGISEPGDSGAPVFRAGTDELVGHVVGGADVVMSYVQDLETQLQACGASIRAT